MRKHEYSEQNLVNLANNLIGTTGLKDQPNKLLFKINGEIHNPHRWHFELYVGPMKILHRKIAEMNLGNLARIVAFAEDSSISGSPFRNTTIRSFLAGPQNNPRSLNFGAMFLAINGSFGLAIMRYLAELVLVGAMYDILMTELVLGVEPEPFGHSEGEPHPYGFEAKQAMVDFVQKHRLNRGQRKNKETETDIKDQTLAMYLKQRFGIKVEYSPEVSAVQKLKGILDPVNTINFFFKIPSGLLSATIIEAVAHYFKMTDPQIKQGEFGNIDNDYDFWIFENKRRKPDGGTELISSYRCSVDQRRIFSIN